MLKLGTAKKVGNSLFVICAYLWPSTQRFVKGPGFQKENRDLIAFGGDKRDRTADLLNAMASGGGQNEYIWIKWTK